MEVVDPVGERGVGHKVRAEADPGRMASHPRSRNMRRAHVERWKRRVRRYYGGYAEGDPRAIGLLAATRAPCSCWMCGNPRRAHKSPHWRLPAHECRADEALEQDMEDEC